jgi:hypothetical protein
MDLDPTDNKKNNRNNLSVSNTFVKVDEFLVHFRSKTVEIFGTNDIRLGIDFSTETLSNNSSIGTNDITNLLFYLTEKTMSSSSSILNEPKLTHSTISTNIFTFLNASTCISRLSAIGMTTICTDVLRADKRRPGLITPVSSRVHQHKSFSSKHVLLMSQICNRNGISTQVEEIENSAEIKTESTNISHIETKSKEELQQSVKVIYNQDQQSSSSSLSTASGVNIDSANIGISLTTKAIIIPEVILDFRQALEACIQLEKAYLSKVCTTIPDD